MVALAEQHSLLEKGVPPPASNSILLGVETMKHTQPWREIRPRILLEFSEGVREPSFPPTLEVL